MKLVRKLILPLSIAVLLRVLLLIVIEMRTGTVAMTDGDTASYIAPGINLILHGAYINGIHPELDRTPGYPIFAMLTGMLHGCATSTALVQIALGAATLLLLARTAYRLFGCVQAAVIAAWLYAFEPLSFTYSARILPETLFTLLMLAVLGRMAAAIEQKQLLPVAQAGLLLAAATFIRPVSCYLAIAFAVGLLLLPSRVFPQKWRLCSAVLMLLTTLPWFALWQARNHQVAGYDGFSSIVDKNLYFYQAAAVTARFEHRSLPEVQHALGYPDEAAYIAAHPEQRDWSQARRLAFMHDQAMRVLRAHPWFYLRSHLTGSAIVALTPSAAELLRMLGFWPDLKQMPQRIASEGLAAAITRMTRNHPVIAVVQLLFLLYLLTLYVLGMRGLLNKQISKPTSMLLIGTVLYFFAVSGGAQAVGRYRHPIMPILCLYAAAGLSLHNHRRAVSATA